MCASTPTCTLLCTHTHPCTNRHKHTFVCKQFTMQMSTGTHKYKFTHVHTEAFAQTCVHTSTSAHRHKQVCGPCPRDCVPVLHGLLSCPQGTTRGRAGAVASSVPPREVCPLLCFCTQTPGGSQSQLPHGSTRGSSRRGGGGGSTAPQMKGKQSLHKSSAN